MPDQYTLTVNTYSGGTGHVNISFGGPGYPTQTWGNNTTNGNWRVQLEDSHLARPDRTVWTTQISHSQLTSLISFITGVTQGPNNNYGLFGLNCVDFIRDAMEVMGLTTDVADTITQQNLPVYHYARLTEFFHDNGLGFIPDFIGFWAGNMGELGVAIGQAATEAWNFVGGVVDAAFTYAGNVASTIGGWGMSAWNFLTNLFGNYGKELPGEEPETVPPDHRPGPWAETNDDDFVLASTAFEETGASDVWNPDSWMPEFGLAELLEEAAAFLPKPVLDQQVEGGLAVVLDQDWAFA